MRSKIEQTVVVVALMLGVLALCAPSTCAQVGEVMEDEESSSEGNAEPRAARNTPRSTDPDESGDVSEDESRDQSVDDWAVEEGPEPFPYRVGADVGIEVGGHMLVSFFTLPSLPQLNAGIGFQGRVATRVIGDLVGEANLGIMFNPENGSDATYKNASLRVGARYPIDLQAKPVLFFLGAGAALDFLAVTTVNPSTAMELSKTAITPAFDLQFGIIYELMDRFAIEAILQGSYAFANVVFLNKDASWFAVIGGVSYDL